MDQSGFYRFCLLVSDSRLIVSIKLFPKPSRIRLEGMQGVEVGSPLFPETYCFFKRHTFVRTLISNIFETFSQPSSQGEQL